MSDYEDDNSDYGGEEWFYVEEEYNVADDLAEHAVQSPPPTTYDDDMLPEWDRFDYFNDLEYASDGYDNASFALHNGDSAGKIGKKRKRGATANRGRKKQRLSNPHAIGQGDITMLSNTPVVWRSQTDRDVKPKLLADNAESYTLLKDWREKLADVPQWTQHSSHSVSPEPSSSMRAKVQPTLTSEPLSPTSEVGVDDDEEGGEIDPAALLAVLQERLAAAGGPLGGMDPQQLLQFAMRMATDKDAGDDIAGDLADELLNQGDDEDEDEEAEANLLSWVAQQRNAGEATLTSADSSAMASTPEQPESGRRSKRLPTPPSSEAIRSTHVTGGMMRDAESSADGKAVSAKNVSMGEGEVSRKRKADDDAESEGTSGATKKRATRSYDAPTVSSQARADTIKTTRGGRGKR